MLLGQKFWLLGVDDVAEQHVDVGGRGQCARCGQSDRGVGVASGERGTVSEDAGVGRDASQNAGALCQSANGVADQLHGRFRLSACDDCLMDKEVEREKEMSNG